ncbi:MAG: MBOAT family O-acyltransferase, partial [Bacteroidota bacterium]
VVFALYWTVAQRQLRIQNLLILAASYFFYGWWDWRFLGLIVLSSLTDFIVGQRIADTPGQQGKKIWLWLSLGLNLGLLGVFKYYGFFVDSFIDLFGQLGYTLPPRSLQIVLPVGISFYTFQTLSYSIDIYRGRIKPSRDLVGFLAFVSFFPQLVAGPIERASNLLPQFSRERQFDLEKAKDGLRLILWGLFKKVVVADGLAASVELLIGFPESYRPLEVVLGLFFFAFMLYGDFSGYSDIAIGTAKVLGFDLMRNFNYPYFARDIMDFWRRWHISLTTWFRDYVFLSLPQGNGAKGRIIFNFIVTFTLSGLWHGANWTFVTWGFLHGLYHIPYLMFPQWRTSVASTRPPFNIPGTLKAIFQTGVTWGLNLFALIFFVSPNMDHAFRLLGRIISPNIYKLPYIYVEEFGWLVLFMLVEWVQMVQKKKHVLQIQTWHPALRWGMYYVLVLLVLYYNYDRKAFIYFQF